MLIGVTVVAAFHWSPAELSQNGRNRPVSAVMPCPVGASPGSVILAADTVAVAVESVDVRSDHLNGSLDVRGAIAAAAGAVDVASDRHTGTAVVRVALLG